MSAAHDDPDEAFAEFLFLTETGQAPDFEALPYAMNWRSDVHRFLATSAKSGSHAVA